jgi:hypothetical protein
VVTNRGMPISGSIGLHAAEIGGNDGVNLENVSSGSIGLHAAEIGGNDGVNLENVSSIHCRDEMVERLVSETRDD